MRGCQNIESQDNVNIIGRGKLGGKTITEPEILEKRVKSMRKQRKGQNILKSRIG